MKEHGAAISFVLIWFLFVMDTKFTPHFCKSSFLFCSFLFLLLLSLFLSFPTEHFFSKYTFSTFEKNGNTVKFETLKLKYDRKKFQQIFRLYYS